MALATYADLKTSIGTWTTYGDVDDQLDDFVAWAHREICRRLRANVLLASATVVVSAETVAQPTGFLAIRRLYLDITPRLALNTVSPEMAIERAGQFGTCTYPDSVAVEGANFRFSPLYSTSTSGLLLYYKEPTQMVLDADTNVVLTKYPYLYLFGALEALYSFKEDSEQADRYGGKFGALLEDINRRDASDMMSGPLVVMPSPGTIV